jgi:hypothetical protein
LQVYSHNKKGEQTQVKYILALEEVLLKIGFQDFLLGLNNIDLDVQDYNKPLRLNQQDSY